MQGSGNDIIQGLRGNFANRETPASPRAVTSRLNGFLETLRRSQSSKMWGGKRTYRHENAVSHVTPVVQCGVMDPPTPITRRAFGSRLRRVSRRDSRHPQRPPASTRLSQQPVGGAAQRIQRRVLRIRASVSRRCGCDGFCAGKPGAGYYRIEACYTSVWSCKRGRSLRARSGLRAGFRSCPRRGGGGYQPCGKPRPSL